MRPAHALPAEYLLGYKMEPTFLVLHLQTDDPFLYGGVGCRLASLQLEIVIELTFPCWVSKFEENTKLHNCHCLF